MSTVGIDSSDLRLWGSRLPRMDRERDVEIEPGDLIRVELPGEAPFTLMATNVDERDGETHVDVLMDPEDEQ